MSTWPHGDTFGGAGVTPDPASKLRDWRPEQLRPGIQFWVTWREQTWPEAYPSLLLHGGTCGAGNAEVMTGILFQLMHKDQSGR